MCVASSGRTLVMCTNQLTANVVQSNLRKMKGGQFKTFHLIPKVCKDKF